LGVDETEAYLKKADYPPLFCFGDTKRDPISSLNLIFLIVYYSSYSIDYDGFNERGDSSMFYYVA